VEALFAPEFLHERLLVPTDTSDAVVVRDKPTSGE